MSRHERARTDAPGGEVKRLKRLAELGVKLTGDPIDVFRTIAQLIGELLDVPIVVLSEIRGDELFFLSSHIHGKTESYPGTCRLADTPCATVRETRDLRVYQNVTQLFPEAAFLKHYKAQSYCGLPALDGDGNVAAVICVLDTKPREFCEEDRYMLQVCAQRIGAELEREKILASKRKFADAFDAVCRTAEEEQARSDSILASMGTGVIIQDMDYRIIYENEFQARTYGSRLGEHCYRAFEGREVICEECPMARSLEDGGIYKYHKSIPLSGGEMHLELTTSALRNAGGEIVGGVKIVKDITEIKRVEERLRKSLAEKEILLREVHHRVKNNLQIIASLLRLQSAHVKDEAARTVFQESQDRVRSMAIIHEEIYRSNDLSRVNMRAYLGNIARSLYRSYGMKPSGVAVTAEDVEDVGLDMDTAIPCGLIVNELVSNALKHAFPGGRQGKVTMGLRQMEEDSFELVVRDDGVGMPPDLDIRKTDTMGLRLVTSLAEHQLQGLVDVERGKGTAFRIQFGPVIYLKRL
jgi:PAS domain S-box-containing protein